MLAVLLGRPLWVARRRRQLRERGIPPEWRPILAHAMPLYTRIPADLRTRLEGLVAQFIAEKEFVGCLGLTVTLEMKLAIAAQACLLVLNRSWAAVSTVTVRQALKLLFTGTARVVHTDSYEVHGFESWADLAVHPDEPAIRTVSLRIKVPEVILLTRYNGIPAKTVVFTRRNLYLRDDATCQYCGRRDRVGRLSIDHVQPRSKGGGTTWENCVLACLQCNATKADRTLHEAGLRLLRKPGRPRWTPFANLREDERPASWQRFTSRAGQDTPERQATGS